MLLRSYVYYVYFHEWSDGPHSELWESIFSSLSVKDGPVYPLLKEAIKEALKRHSLVLTELSSSYYGHFADISVMSLG